MIAGILKDYEEMLNIIRLHGSTPTPGVKRKSW